MNFTKSEFYGKDDLLMDLPIYRLVQMYKDLRDEGVGLGLDPYHHPTYSTFKNATVALATIERMQSSIRAAKESHLSFDQDFTEPVKETKVPKKKKSTKMKIPGNAIITVLTESNPKRGTAADRFAFYKTGMTIGEYANLVGDFTKAVNDVIWDSDRKWIRYDIPAILDGENIVVNEEAA